MLRNWWPASFGIRIPPHPHRDRDSEPVAICDQFPEAPRPAIPPYGFAKHGAIMAATILNSPRAVEMSLYVVRAFVRLRELLRLRHRARPQAR